MYRVSSNLVLTPLHGQQPNALNLAKGCPLADTAKHGFWINYSNYSRESRNIKNKASIPHINVYKQVFTIVNYFSSTYNYQGINIVKEKEITNKTLANNIKDMVRKWLMDDGWSLRKQSYPESVWTFVAEDTYAYY